MILQLDRGLHVEGDAHINGDLTITGDLQRVTETTLAVEDKYIIANSSTGTATEDGGMLVQRAAATNQASNTGAPNTLGTHAGIRFNEGTGLWEITSGTTNEGGIDGDWEAIGTATGGVTTVIPGAGLLGSDTDDTDVSTAVEGNITLNLALTPLAIDAVGVTPGGGLFLDGAGNSRTVGIATGGITVGQLAARANGANPLASNNRTGLGNGSTGQVLTSTADGGFAWSNGGTVS